ncbi:MAG: CYTH domain-containing protein [Nanoarchaeota archaeon]|nr:CYTH domain-containing protein [Nanoarchaeota archaeon]MBU1622327.1 CYTH domain-containing protein [Nanoarchaeota archaeon]MBU1974176.1 CYTH domain-containing protein [Nanoarchaeota archaeon]
MGEELKIKIENHKEIEEKLQQLGAKFTEELNVTDTYFNQPSDEVLKITEDERGDFLVNLKSKEGKFEIVKYEKVENIDKIKKELTNKHGIKCILKKKRRFFDFQSYKININLIEDLGEFLIVEGENLTEDIISNKLKMDNPEFVKVPFCDLKQHLPS